MPINIVYDYQSGTDADSLILTNPSSTSTTLDYIAFTCNTNIITSALKGSLLVPGSHIAQNVNMDGSYTYTINFSSGLNIANGQSLSLENITGFPKGALRVRLDPSVVYVHALGSASKEPTAISLVDSCVDSACDDPHPDTLAMGYIENTVFNNGTGSYLLSDVSDHQIDRPIYKGIKFDAYGNVIAANARNLVEFSKMLKRNTYMQGGVSISGNYTALTDPTIRGNLVQGLASINQWGMPIIDLDLSSLKPGNATLAQSLITELRSACPSGLTLSALWPCDVATIHTIEAAQPGLLASLYAQLDHITPLMQFSSSADTVSKLLAPLSGSPSINETMRVYQSLLPDTSKMLLLLGTEGYKLPVASSNDSCLGQPVLPHDEVTCGVRAFNGEGLCSDGSNPSGVKLYSTEASSTAWACEGTEDAPLFYNTETFATGKIKGDYAHTQGLAGIAAWPQYDAISGRGNAVMDGALGIMPKPGAQERAMPVGGIVGGVLGFVAVAALGWFCCRRKKATATTSAGSATAFRPHSSDDSLYDRCCRRGGNSGDSSYVTFE